MHFLSTFALPLLAATLGSAMPTEESPPAAAVHGLSKRCSPLRDPAFHNGYLPPAPCWQSFDTACQPHLLRGTETLVSATFSSAVVFNVDEYCFGLIAEEQAREADGRRTYGWSRSHGRLVRAGSTRTLLITNMTAEAVAHYQALLTERPS